MNLFYLCLGYMHKILNSKKVKAFFEEAPKLDARGQTNPFKTEPDPAENPLSNLEQEKQYGQ